MAYALLLFIPLFLALRYIVCKRDQHRRGLNDSSPGRRRPATRNGPSLV